MLSKIIAGLDKKDAEEMKSSFNSSVRLRERIIYLLNEEIKSINKKMLSEENYESNNWSLKQVGYITEIKTIENLKKLLF